MSEEDFLKDAYRDRTDAEMRAYYDEWARQYDKDMDDRDYAQPRRCSEALAALLDPEKAGWGLCAFADVSLKDHSAENRRNFERFVEAADEVMECHSLAGARDYLLKIRAPDISAYEAFLMERLLTHPAVASAASSFSLRELKYTTAVPV